MPLPSFTSEVINRFLIKAIIIKVKRIYFLFDVMNIIYTIYNSILILHDGYSCSIIMIMIEIMIPIVMTTIMITVLKPIKALLLIMMIILIIILIVLLLIMII